MTPAASPRYTLPLASAEGSPVALIGTKAAGLAWLLARRFDVPEGFVLTTAAFARSVEAGDDDAVPVDVAAALHEAAAALGDGPLAVRSSAVDEDAAGSSGAGVYDSVLGAEGAEQLEGAVRRCWASASLPAARAHRARLGLAAPTLAVVVQRLVPAEVAGIALTADPVTGEGDVTVVSATAGTGERLAAGEAAEEWWVRDGDAERRRGGGVLTPPQAAAVAGLAQAIAGAAGTPQDVEWALAAGRVWVLQSRPMTALPQAVSWEAPLPGGWLRNFRLGEWFPEPLTPLFATWLVERVEARVRLVAQRDAGVTLHPPLHILVHGWYFHSPLGTSPPSAMLAALWRRPRFLLAGLAASLRPEWSERLFVVRCAAAWTGQVLPAYRAAVARGTRQLAEDPPQGAVVALIDEVADAVGDSFWSMSMVGGFAWKAETALARYLRRHVPGLAGGHQPLLSGLRAPAAAPAHAVVSLDWVHPTLGEFGASEAPAPRTDAAARRDAAEAAAVAALGGRRLQHFQRLVSLARRYAVLREEQSDALTLGWPLLRAAVLRLGAHLAAAGSVQAAEDVYFLTRAELDAGLRGEPVGADVAQRRRVWQQQRRLVPPLSLGRLPRFFADALGRQLEVLRTPGDRGGITGLPASPGRATGPVRVLHDPYEPSRLRDGEVLVAPLVTSAWLPLLARSAAVVTDGGHVAAHASLLVRELGVPAVMATGDATARLRDGDVVTVDGGAGVVAQHAAPASPT